MTNSVIIAFRIPPEVKAGIAMAAKRKFTAQTEYLRQIIVEAVNRDGGFEVAERDMKTRHQPGREEFKECSNAKKYRSGDLPRRREFRKAQ